MNYLSASRTTAGLLLLGALAACGSSSDPGPAAAASAPATFTVTGTAATGAAFAGATVSLVDSTGAPFAANAVTAADGSYIVKVLQSAKPPFVVQAISADKATTLVSVVSEAKDTNTNITPITNLIASRLSPSGDPTKLAGELKAGTAAFTTATLQVKVAEIVALIKPLMDAAGDSSDPLNGKLVADGSSSADKVLDSLTITITPSSASSVDIVVGQKTAAGSDSVAPITFAGGGTNTPVVQTVAVVLNGTPSVPADVALKPASSTCSALHSGTYRVVMPAAATTLPLQYGKLQINAETLAIIDTDGSTSTWAANGPCQYTADAGKSDIVVSPAGVIVARYVNNAGTTYNVAIAFPDQSHTQAELVGNWNALSMEWTAAATATTPALYTGTAMSATITAAGALTAGMFCQNTATWDVKVCTNVPDAQLAITANTDGGFDFFDKGAINGRVFAYRAGGGELMLVEVDTDGSFTMFTHQRTNGLPTVATGKTSWSVFIGKALTSPNALGASNQTILSVDTTAGSWVRNSANNVGLTNTHAETLFGNNPRNGFTFRAPGSAPAADGTTATISEFTALGLRGMGLSPLLLPASKSFLISVDKP